MGILNRLQLWWNWLTTDPLGFALYLLYFEGLSCEAAAKAMGKSRKQLYNLTARAKAAMREQLEKEGFADEDGLGI